MCRLDSTIVGYSHASRPYIHIERKRFSDFVGAPRVAATAITAGPEFTYRAVTLLAM